MGAIKRCSHGSEISLNCITRRTLLEGVKAGDQCKITEFYNGYKNIIRLFAAEVARRQGWFLNNDDLADVIQEVLTSILKSNTLSYDVEKGAKFRTWLKRVVQNKVVDLVRTKCRTPKMVSFDDNQMQQGRHFKTVVSEDCDTSDECPSVFGDASLVHEPSDEVAENACCSSGEANEEVQDALEEAKSARTIEKHGKGEPLSPPLISDDPLKRLWDEEWHRELIRKALVQLKKEKDPVHYHVFCFLVLEDNPAEVVAENFGQSVENVYVIRSRCQKRLQTIIRHLNKQL